MAENAWLHTDKRADLGALECELGDEDVERLDALKESYLTRYANPSKAWGVKLFEGLEDA